METNHSQYAVPSCQIPSDNTNLERRPKQNVCRYRRRWSCAVLAMMLASAVCIAATTHEEGRDLNVTRATLTNGLRILIVRNPLAPVVTTIVNYRVGSDECPPGFPGTAHALEHMMFRGSPGLSAEQLAEVTTAIGGDSNADTQQTVTQYFFTAPAEDLEVALHIEAVRMRAVLNTESLWKKERGAIEQEVAQDLSNPEYLFYLRLLEAFFKGTPYEHDALGTRPSFDKMTGALLKQFHETWYAPNNAILIVVGEVQPVLALEQIQKLFGNIPARKLPARPAHHFEPVQPQALKFDTDQPTGTAAISFRFPGSDSADNAAAQVLADVLSSQRGQLYGLVPSGKALLAAFAYDSLPKAGLGYVEAGFPDGADAETLLSEVRNILAATVAQGVPADLVEAAKRREVASAELEKNSVFGLAMSWSQAVAVEGRNSPDDDIEAIKRVTVADVNRVAKEYLDLDHAVSAILMPQASGKPVSSKSFGGRESFTPTRSTGARLPVWAKRAVNRLAIPESTLHPVDTRLPNGLRLIVQPQTVSDTVSVFGRVKTNSKLETPPGQEGVDQALDMLFSYGTRSLDRLAFQKALDDIGALETAGADFSVQVLAEHFDRGVQLLAENVISPALPEADFRILQPQLAAAIAGELKSPNYLAARALESALFPKHDPVQRETTPATVHSLSIQDVRAYHRLAFRPDLTTIVVMGKVTPETAQAVIAKYFGAWQATGPKPNTLFPPAPLNAPATITVPDVSRVQDQVTLAQTLSLTRTDADYYALELGNHVLGGGFYATRLYRDLREKNGLVYYVGSVLDVGQTRSLYEVSYACDHPKAAKARAIVVSNLKDMQRKKVSPHELRQAKILLLREIPLSEESVDKVADGWLARSLLDLPLDEPIQAAHRYVKLEAAEVRAVFAKWLRPADLVQVIQGPDTK
jgi:zinc protease